MPKISEERRKHPRYDVTGKTALVTAPQIIVSDHLIDLSLGGLSFNYEGFDPFSSNVWVQLDIVRGDVRILGIPAKIISDAAVSKSQKCARRCGIKFGNLSSSQKRGVSFLVYKFIPRA